MAETIVSPGVFTQENDQSFLPAGVAAIGAAIVGPTAQGPAFVPLVVKNFSEYVSLFGGLTDTTYVPHTVKEYLRAAGSVTVCRVLAGGGYNFDGADKQVVALVASSSAGTEGHGEILAVLFPSKNTDNAESLELGDSSITTTSPVSISQSFGLTLSGSAGAATPKNITCSLLPTDAEGAYITTTDIRTLGSSNNSKDGADYDFNAFLRLNFEKRQKALQIVATTNIALVKNTSANEFTSSYAEGYNNATTPYITSQLDTAGNSTSLFRLHTLADGDDTNQKFKVSIYGLKTPANINGEKQYTTFNLAIREYSDDDFNNTNTLETFTNCTLDPTANNYIARKIGDKQAYYSNKHNKVVVKGSYPNLSKLVRIEVTSQVEDGEIDPNLAPKGFKAVKDTIKGFVLGNTNCYLPSASYKTESVNNNTTPSFNQSAYLGWQFSGNTDNVNWIGATPKTPEDNAFGDFNVENYFVHPSASITWAGKSLSASIDVAGTTGPTNDFLKFSVPFQGGSDGVSPTVVPLMGGDIVAGNVFGLDLSSTSTAGTKGYNKALNILSNQDEYDINMLALPGVIKELHQSVTDAAINMVEKRGDAFYVMDLAQYDSTVLTALSEAEDLDTNYAAAYYPWVQVQGEKSTIWAPPSVIVPGVIAKSDQDSHPWFAPAGLSRGRIAVQGVAINLNQAERDLLYEARINPIANFPNVGACIWGQKTLQLRSSALDRINVRRLLITVKKFIASSSKFLLFEQNTAATRNRFLNIVNPYLEGVQQNQGLYAFRVQMDESNNTADVVDRNQLVGAIYLQPTKTAEFIVLDFNVLPTGATFPS